jgi:hypothetical protein
MKKMVNNTVIQECFTNYLKESSIINDDDLKRWQYTSDMILVNFLDQIWMHYFLLPMVNDLVESLIFEIQISHSKDRMSDLFQKKFLFGRIIRLIEKVHSNQQCKDSFSRVVNPTMDSAFALNNSLILIEEFVYTSIKKLVSEIHRSSSSFTDFCRDIKIYEQTKFVTKNY